MSKMMKSRVCMLRLHDEFVNSCFAVLCFPRVSARNSNDTFPFASVETGNAFALKLVKVRGG